MSEKSIFRLHVSLTSDDGLWYRQNNRIFTNSLSQSGPNNKLNILQFCTQPSTDFPTKKYYLNIKVYMFMFAYSYFNLSIFT